MYKTLQSIAQEQYAWLHERPWKRTVYVAAKNGAQGKMEYFPEGDDGLSSVCFRFEDSHVDWWYDLSGESGWVVVRREEHF